MPDAITRTVSWYFNTVQCNNFAFSWYSSVRYVCVFVISISANVAYSGKLTHRFDNMRDWVLKLGWLAQETRVFTAVSLIVRWECCVLNRIWQMVLLWFVTRQMHKHQQTATSVYADDIPRDVRVESITIVCKCVVSISACSVMRFRI